MSDKEQAKQALREKAEEILRTTAQEAPIAPAETAPEEVRRLLHELRVHQIELDLQNTELRRSQEELDGERRRYFDLYDLAPVGYCTVSEPGLILEANLSAINLLGVTRYTFIGRRMSQFILDEDQNIYYRHRKQLFETGEAQECDLRLVKPDGTSFWAHLKGTAAQGEEGAPVCRVVIVDITERKQAEEALRESEVRLTSLLDETKVHLWVFDGKHYTFLNKQWYDFTGLKQSDGMTIEIWTSIVHPDDLPKATEIWLKHWATKTEHDNFFRLRRHDGLYRDFFCHTLPLFDENGVFQAFQGVNLDITERKQAEEENRRFKTISDNAVYGKAIADLDGNLLYVNRFFANIHGYEPEQLIGKHLSLFHSRDQMEVVDGLNATMMREGYFTTTTLWHRHQDGRAFPMLMNGNLIKDEYGKSQCLAVSAIDMSAHHLAEEALRESEERFRMLASESPVSIVAFDREGRVTFVSDWHLTKFAKGQLGPEFFLARKVWELPSLVSSGVAEKVRCILSGKSLYADEVHVPSNSIGEEAYQSMRGVPFRRDGAIVGGVLIREDITARKQAEADREKLQAQLQQAQKMEAIGTLAGGIAHDFNNILGAILGYAEMAQEDSPAGSTVRQDIDQVVKASHRAKELVKQILAFSRQAETKYIPLQPAFIIQEAIKMLRSSLPSTIDIKQHIDMDAGLILASPTQIHQIVMNLGTNAFHAMEETGGTLIISLLKKTLDERDIVGKPGVQPGDFVQLSIGDTGPGIAPEIREKIFEPYFTTKEVGKGTGMGLAIIHGIAKSYKGFVSCHSVLDEGTVFHVYLPVLSEPAALKALSSPSDFTQLGHERILFVDDEELLAEMGKVMLERLGYHVTVRRNSLEALNTFQNEPDQFDLVITDQTMPGMTGIDMARRMLQIRPGMPIILCTGYSSLISEDKAKSLGIKGFAMKPLAKKDIAVLIREVLDGKGTAMVDTKP